MYDQSKVKSDDSGGGFAKKAVLAATAAAIGAGAVLAYFYLRAGDEPPIRVRGGSMYFELLTATEKFSAQGSHWTVTGPQRRTDEYLVYLAPTNPAFCNNTTVHKKKKVLKFVHRTASGVTAEVEVRATGNKTKVSGPLVKTTDRLLEHRADGFLWKVILDGVEVCTFNATTDLDSVLLSEE